MALRSIVDDINTVPEAFRGEYTKKDDNKWHLNVEGGEDTGALKRSLENARRERDDAKAEVTRVKTAQEEAERNALLASGDVAKITADYEKRLKDERIAAAAREAAALAASVNAERKVIAERLAREISTAPSLISDKLLSRIHVDMIDGIAVARVLDADGKASATSLSDLTAEFIANPEFAPIIIASKAAGGGAGSKPNAGGMPAGNGAGNGIDLAKMTEGERTALYRRDPAAFEIASQALQRKL